MAEGFLFTADFMLHPPKKVYKLIQKDYFQIQTKKICMKKLIVLLVVATACSFTALHAQPPGGGQRMSPEERIALWKERLKPLGLTQVQTDSAIAIYSERPTNMGNFMEMSQEERQAAMKAVGEARLKRLVKAGIPEETAKKVAEALQMRGPGGGQRPQGNGNKK
ncbi:MAG: hypothetical protein C0459_08435 [Chitinophaga sp.]|jgi:hypothetical protein|nr:hypothetical protein [Chitinophaga sp.]